MSLVSNLKESEDSGFKTKGFPYKDHLGYDTVGYGTLLPLSEEECTLLLEHRLNNYIAEFDKKFPNLLGIDEIALDIVYEMSYQLGIPRFSKFKKMIKALEDRDYKSASEEGKDSLWYKQTRNRAERLMSSMRAIRQD